MTSPASDRQQDLADFYQLDEPGRYRLVSADDEGVYRSRVLPGFWLRIDWLWQQPLPRVLDVLKALEVV